MSSEFEDKIDNLAGEIFNTIVKYDDKGDELIGDEYKQELEHYLTWIADFQEQVIDPLFESTRREAQPEEEAGRSDKANEILGRSALLPIVMETMILKEAIRKLIAQANKEA